MRTHPDPSAQNPGQASFLSRKQNLLITFALLTGLTLCAQAGKGGNGGGNGGGGGGGKGGGGGGGGNELVPAEIVLHDVRPDPFPHHPGAANVLLDDTEGPYVDEDNVAGTSCRISNSQIFFYPHNINSDTPAERHFHLPGNYLTGSTVTDPPTLTWLPALEEFQIPSAQLRINGPDSYLSMAIGQTATDQKFWIVFIDTLGEHWAIDFGYPKPREFKNQVDDSDTMAVKRVSETQWEFWTEGEGTGFLYHRSATSEKGPNKAVFKGTVNVPLSATLTILSSP